MTWSENLDQTQAVAGTAFSVAPNGGAGIAGTGSAVSYPAANQTRFTLASTVHHLDSLTLDYTTPGSRSEEHTTELPSLRPPVCPLLLDKKNNTANVAP